YVMTMTGQERSAATLLVSSTLANAVGSIMLIKWFGLTGAAVGTAVALVAWNVAMAVFLWRRVGVVPGVIAMHPGGRREKSRAPSLARVPPNSRCAHDIERARP